MDEKYLPELMAEKDSLDPSFTHTLRLVSREIEKFQKGEGKDEEKYIDVVINKNMKLGQKASARMGHALEEIKRFLIPDYNDEIRQAQLQELTYLNGGSENAGVPLVRGKPTLRTGAQEAYGEYDYVDRYGTAHDEQSYNSYDNSYLTPAQSGTDYYDYGHGLSEETYDSYGQEEWTNSRHKAPSARTARASTGTSHMADPDCTV
ncbi:KH domain-containing, RNA-binding, signal transduction-associated protein 3 [Heterocephalus glaber]|uniref:KH domain-containing, RNA-binding, signal transduction-associated protein 3 n=1 Tax=Heterocephalus glaber TaxID=10181 RepID=G5CAA5_HETGA|nr:KH domain-containing, RNA-binding, signal transduction-associated protein 3 [Heterocephalus glaber]